MIFTTRNEVWGKVIFLPPANEVCEGYVFTGVCLSTGGHAWQGSCVAGGMHGRWACMVGDVRDRRDGHCSNQYASYWNAFLFTFVYSALKWSIITLLGGEIL